MEKEDDQIVCEQRGRVGWIRLNRPKSLNAITLKMIDALAAMLKRLQADRELCAVVIEGSSRAFSAGADLKELQPSENGDGLASGPGSFPDRFNRTLIALEEFPVPVIAAVRGWALAGGLEIVLCCDLVVAGESARFGDAHANYGLLPSGGASARLPRWLGPMRAKELMFTGESFTAAEMKAAGLVTRLVPDEEVESEAKRISDLLSLRSPAGLRRMKSLAINSQDQSKAASLRAEQLQWALHANSRDMREGLAAFREKRSPQFSGS